MSENTHARSGSDEERAVEHSPPNRTLVDRLFHLVERSVFDGWHSWIRANVSIIVILGGAYLTVNGGSEATAPQQPAQPAATCATSAPGNPPGIGCIQLQP